MALSRRKFLTNSLIYGCSAAASPLITPVTLAAAPWEPRLVVIVLRGALDGLDAVRPVGDKSFAKLRPNLSGEGQFDLNGFYAANAGLGKLQPLWDDGQLAFAHAVSTPYRDRRSHFEGQDLLEAGYRSWDEYQNQDPTGWLNRMLTLVPGVTTRTAFAVGREDMILLNGDAPTANWSPDGRIDLSDQGRRFLELIYEKDPLFHENAEIALELSQGLRMMSSGGGGDMMAEAQMTLMKASKASRSQALAKFAAKRLNEETRIAAFSIGGWDTHRRQDKTLPRALGALSETLLVLRDQLGHNWDKTTVLCLTEFGRTARENGNIGTDHGTGGAMLMAGGAVRGGKVYGDWPGLGSGNLYAERDLMPTKDVRSFAGWAMHDLFGLPQSDIERTVFPGLDMGSNSRFIL